MTATESSIPSKISKSNPFIGTHDGRFHCDDVTACYMLKTMDRFKNHDIVRTRDADKLAQAEIIVDVGGELNVDTLRLDHHQRTFNQTILDYHPKMKVTNPDHPIKLSSSGLVYSIFGKDFITNKLGFGKVYADLKDEKNRDMVDRIYEKAYLDIFEEIDAIDNGVEVVSDPQAVYNYHINSGLSSRVGRFNPPSGSTPEERLEKFVQAMKMVGDEIGQIIEHLSQEWWPKRERFVDSVHKRKEFDESGQVVFLEEDLVSVYRSLLYDLEKELGIQGEIKYLVYKNETQWRAQAVSVDSKSFKSRVPLKEEWRGKRDEDLQNTSGIPDANFVHMSGFTGGAGTLEGIKRMVRVTLGMDANGQS